MSRGKGLKVNLRSALCDQVYTRNSKRLCHFHHRGKPEIGLRPVRNFRGSTPVVPIGQVLAVDPAGSKPR